MRRKLTRVALAACLIALLVPAFAMATGTKEATAAKKVKVIYIPISTGIPYFDPIIAAMKQAVTDLGGEFASTAPDSPDPTSQIPYIRAAIQQGFDVIYISPNSPDALLSVLDEAKSKGIHVLMVNDDIIGNESHREAAIMNTNYDDLAKELFMTFAKLLNYSGDFTIASSTTDAPYQNNQIRIYKELMANDPQLKNMNLVEITYDQADPTKSLTVAETTLQKYPNLKGILCPNSVAIVATCQAVENAGVQKKVLAYGTGTPNQMRDFIKRGTTPSFYIWDTTRTGYVAGYFAVGVARGTIKIAKGATFEVPGYGTIKIGDKNLIYAGPPLKVDKTNIDKYNF